MKTSITQTLNSMRTEETNHETKTFLNLMKSEAT